MFAYLAARLREPSTHAGVAALFALLIALDPARKDVFAAFAAFFAAIAAITPDPTSTATSAPAPGLAAEVDQSTKEK